jgi:ACS family glucarate transporter-like MFS transporter
VANAVVIAGVALGSAITPPAVAYLVEGVGWQRALLCTAAPAFALAGLWFGLGRDGPRRASREENQRAAAGDDGAGVGQAPDRPGPAGSAGLLRDRNLWLLTVSYALLGYVSYIFVYWFFLYLVRERHFDLLEGSWLATMPWLLTLATMPLGGLLSDRLVARLGYPWGRRLLPLVALVLAGALLCLGARAENPYLAVGLFAVCEALVMAVEGTFWASAIEIAREHSGSGGGILNAGGNLGGLLSPYATPLIAERLGWVAALDVGAAVAVAAGLLWLWISPGGAARRQTAAAGGGPLP